MVQGMRKRSVDVTMPLAVDGARVVAIVRCGAEGGSCRTRMGLAWVLPRCPDFADDPSPALPDFVLTNDTGVSPSGQDGQERLSKREQLARAVWTRQEMPVRGEDLARDDYDGWTDMFLCFAPTRPRPGRLLNMGHNAYVHEDNERRVETLGGHGLRFGAKLKAAYQQYQATRGSVQNILLTRGPDTVVQRPRTLD